MSSIVSSSFISLLSFLLLVQICSHFCFFPFSREHMESYFPSYACIEPVNFHDQAGEEGLNVLFEN